jgi:hypothetical protein
VTVNPETATVYRGGGRRWFTPQAACRAEARARLKVDCGCDYCDHEGYGREHITCSRHKPDRYPKIVRRLTRIYLAAYRAAKETP